MVWTPEHERNIKQGAKGKDSDQGERKKSVKPTEEGVHKDQDPAVSTLIIDNFELEVETYPDPMTGSETSSGYEEELLSGNNMILTIDPDHQVIDFYRRYLSSHGYTVIAVTELDQAVSVARGIQPAAITLDISMRSSKVTNNGSLDGWAVLEALKSDPSTQNIPLVVCSLVDEREKAMKLGADEYLIKPILANDLATAINRLQNK